MADSADQNVKFRIVGKQVLNGKVLADVFSKKLGQLVKAMEAADRSANGKKHYDYVIVDMAASSAAATIREIRSSNAVPTFSSAERFEECIRAVDNAQYAIARRHMECTVAIASIAKDVEIDFDFIEFTVGNHKKIVADKPFFDRATEAVTLPPVATDYEWFKGATVGSFDGTIVVEDVRDKELPKLTLRLTAGEKEVLCRWVGFKEDEFSHLLGKRVRIRGLAHYDGTSGLPVWIDIQEPPRQIKVGADLTRWAGAFKPFILDEWESSH